MKKKNLKFIYFSETLNFADFKYVFRFFISCFGQQLQPLAVGPCLAILSLLWRTNILLKRKDL